VRGPPTPLPGPRCPLHPALAAQARLPARRQAGSHRHAGFARCRLRHGRRAAAPGCTVRVLKAARACLALHADLTPAGMQVPPQPGKLHRGRRLAADGADSPSDLSLPVQALAKCNKSCAPTAQLAGRARAGRRPRVTTRHARGCTCRPGPRRACGWKINCSWPPCRQASACGSSCSGCATAAMVHSSAMTTCTSRRRPASAAAAAGSDVPARRQARAPLTAPGRDLVCPAERFQGQADGTHVPWGPGGRQQRGPYVAGGPGLLCGPEAQGYL